MPRHTFLDAILNRPSQNYAPAKGEQRWNAPTDLPNAPVASSNSILGSGGSMFRRKAKSGKSGDGSGMLSNLGSEAGASTSTMGIRSRFGRKKRQPSALLGDVSGTTGNGSFYSAPPQQHQQQHYGSMNRYPPPPSSVADSQATASKKKTRWWEAGGLSFGRRSRAPSIAGDSIFSEPEPAPGQVPWNSHGMTGIGSGAGTRRVARSDFGASPSRRPAQAVPPLPNSPQSVRKGGPGSTASTSASPAGRLHSDVAPLGVSSLNPSLNKRPSRTKMSVAAASAQPIGADVRRSASSANLSRSKSPPPPPMHGASARVPGSLAASAHVRRLSHDAKRSPVSDGTDWKDFVKSMSGTEIAKAWQGTREAPDMAQAATGVRTSVNLERRKSHYDRVQKELQQDAQFEQTLRDPGVLHQDLLARAASQVVGGAAPLAADGQEEYLNRLQPGVIIPSQDRRLSEQHRGRHEGEVQSPPLPEDTSAVREAQRDDADVRNSTLTDSSTSQTGDESEQRKEEEYDEESSEAESEEEESFHKQTMLDVVNEEDEDASSQGTASRRQSLMPAKEITTNAAETAAPRFKAFEAALNKNRNSISSSQGIHMDSSSARSTPIPTAYESDTKTTDEVVVSKELPSVIVSDSKVDEDAEEEKKETLADDHRDERRTKRVEATGASSEVAADSDEDDNASQNSGHTGRATVTFRDVEDKGDARSMRSVASRASRPGTLQRRLSDVSLGTSFGVSNIMQIGRSRPNSQAGSSRKIKLADGDDDSAGSSRSDDDEMDEDLKQRIKSEQERLRNMKVGDDFFGGSLNAILDKFDSTNWEEGLSATVGQLGLDVGTQGSKRNSISAQDVLALNAQERLMEVRRQRTEGASPSTRRQELSETRTVESGVAPSFAALWLLNQSTDTGKSISPDGSTDEMSAKRAEKSTAIDERASQHWPSQHVRQASTASSEGATVTTSHSPTPAARARNLLGVASTSATPERKISVMDRPRNRGPKPREMGGVSIARGKLVPDAKAESPQDTRNILSDVWIPQTLSQMKEAKAAAASAATSSPARRPPSEVDSAASPPISPIAKVAPSKDKPAPVKSAIKTVVPPSRSLADTLFTFPVDKSAKRKHSMPNLRTKGKDKAVQYRKESVPSMPVQEKKAVNPVPPNIETPSRQSYDGPSQDSSSLTTPTPVRPANPRLQKDEDEEEEEGEGEGGIGYGSTEDFLDDDIEEVQTAVPAPDIRYGNDPSPLSSTRSPPPTSELWSGESVISTGPATPGVSEIFDRNAGPMQRLPFIQAPSGASEVHSTPSPRDKKLPLPPVPAFLDEMDTVRVIEEDITPLAVHRADPIHADESKTPHAERDESAFGMNIIPPTPPAEDVQPFMRLATVQTPETLREEEGDAAGKGQAYEQSLQRSSSSKSKARSSISLTRKGSTKRRSGNTASVQEYQGHGLSLPPGLIATTVATSAGRRHSNMIEDPVEPVTEPNGKSRKAKERSKSVKEQRKVKKSGEEERPIVSGSQDMQHSLSAKLASLSPPVPDRSEGSSSGRGSDLGISRSGSQSPSPAVSVSDRSSAMSSAVSSSAASDASSRGGGSTSTKHTSNGQPHGRKIRTVTSGPNGHARTSLMSAISEWENSPMDGADRSQSASPMPYGLSRSPSGYASPVPQAQYMNAAMPGPSGYHSPIYTGASSVTRSQSSIYSGSSPSLVRNAPVGAPTDTMLEPKTVPGASRRLSVPLSDFTPWASSITGGDESEGGHSQYSTASLPNVPQSSYRARDPHKASNAIDDRLYAKTTMATIAVTSGAFRSKTIRGRKSSVDLRQGEDHAGGGISGRRSSMDLAGEGVLVDELQKTTMALTSHTAPPRKLSSSQVLVQVIACAIDEMDKLLLREKVRNETAYGFIPGRSFCGRIMETGWEVKRMRLGDIVFGLQTSRKCGALAEFMTVEEDLVAKAPQDCLTMEQIAALPSVGVMAHQLMVNHCSQLKRGSRILILNAHDGVGLLAMQECSTLGLIIVAHCPNQVSDGVAICEANGAHEVIVGEPLWALNTLHESSLDLVVDTVGGRRVYDASRRILAFGGQFCTFFGDLHSSGGANPNLRSHLRSLRRSFFKKDAKQIGYEWVGTDTAEDCREALEAVRRAAEDGLICPRLKSVLAFGEGPRAFEDTLRGMEEEPGATVVRIS